MAKEDKAWKTDSVKSAVDLLAYLRQSGTPTDRLKSAERWLLEHGEATAGNLYDFLAAEDASLGTLRKAGKWTYGATFEPETMLAQAPADEILRLRAENENLQAALQQANAQRLAYQRQRDFQAERCNDLSRQVQALKGGRTKEDLIAAGVE